MKQSVGNPLAVDRTGNVVGIDPHKRTLSATVLDSRGGVLGQAHFKVSGEGHRMLEQWTLQFGPVARWGVEGRSHRSSHVDLLVRAGP